MLCLDYVAQALKENKCSQQAALQSSKKVPESKLKMNEILQNIFDNLNIAEINTLWKDLRNPSAEDSCDLKSRYVQANAHQRGVDKDKQRPLTFEVFKQ